MQISSCDCTPLKNKVPERLKQLLKLGIDPSDEITVAKNFSDLGQKLLQMLLFGDMCDFGFKNFPKPEFVPEQILATHIQFIWIWNFFPTFQSLLSVDGKVKNLFDIFFTENGLTIHGKLLSCVVQKPIYIV